MTIDKRQRESRCRNPGKSILQRGKRPGVREINASADNEGTGQEASQRAAGGRIAQAWKDLELIRNETEGPRFPNGGPHTL